MIKDTSINYRISINVQFVEKGNGTRNNGMLDTARNVMPGQRVDAHPCQDQIVPINVGIDLRGLMEIEPIKLCEKEKEIFGSRSKTRYDPYTDEELSSDEYFWNQMKIIVEMKNMEYFTYFNCSRLDYIERMSGM